MSRSDLVGVRQGALAIYCLDCALWVFEQTTMRRLPEEGRSPRKSLPSCEKVRTRSPSTSSGIVPR